ncbi:MAG TPA: phosphatase PAP2 family protein [Dehalococcoidia bacterium]|nr:phosphatase PAP2 family protein [Dehalococcoidia bacterium]
MTTGTQQYRRSAPASVQDWIVVFRSAGITIVRGTAIMATAILLVLVRGDVSIYFQVGAAAASMACLYVALGAGARSLGFYIVMFVLFAQLRAHADEIGTPVRYVYAVDAEKLFFLGHIPTIELQNLFYSHARLGVLEGYSMAVYLSYFILPHAVALVLWKWDRRRFRVYVPAFLLTVYAGLLFCAIVPTAPPWMASEAGLIPRVYQVVPDITEHLAPGAYQQGTNSAGTNAVAAMPSLHCAVPWLLVMALWQHRRVRWLALWYALSMTFAVVYLGEHYFVDSLAGLGLAAAAWAAATHGMAWWDGRAEAANASPLVNAALQGDSVSETAP